LYVLSPIYLFTFYLFISHQAFYYMKNLNMGGVNSPEVLILKARLVELAAEYKAIKAAKFRFITYFWNLIKKQQPQGGLTIDSRWL
jgi:hypothetical protein